MTDEVARAIVCVRRAGDADVRDLEVATALSAGELAALLAGALGWPTTNPAGAVEYALEAHPPGRILRHDETLAEAGVWDGSSIIGHPLAPPPPPPAISQRMEAPGVRWVPFPATEPPAGVPRRAERERGRS